MLNLSRYFLVRALKSKPVSASSKIFGGFLVFFVAFLCLLFLLTSFKKRRAPPRVRLVYCWMYSWVAILLSTYLTAKAKTARPINIAKFANALCNGLWSIACSPRISDEPSFVVERCLACFSCSSFLRSSSFLMVWKFKLRKFEMYQEVLYANLWL